MTGLAEFIEARLAEWQAAGEAHVNDNGMCDYLGGIHFERDELLRLVASGRLILDNYRQAADDYHNTDLAVRAAWEQALRAVGTWWQDHPGYQPEWAPGP